MYEDLVKAGRRAVKSHSGLKWALGDLALLVAPMGADGVHNDSGHSLEEYAHDIDCELDALRGYRMVADRYPPDTRLLDASWTLHRNAKPEELTAYLESETAAPTVRGFTAWAHSVQPVETFETLMEAVEPEQEAPEPLDAEEPLPASEPAPAPEPQAPKPAVPQAISADLQQARNYLKTIEMNADLFLSIARAAQTDERRTVLTAARTWLEETLSAVDELLQ